MINQKVLLEKMKYLITANSAKQFSVEEVYMEFEYMDPKREKLISYDIDVKFDYFGSIDIDFEDFLTDIKTMQEKMKDVLNLYIITSDGKLIEGKNSNCFSINPMVYNVTYEADTKHIFNLGYKFLYEQD